jgi:hypothetical protein
MLHLNVIGFGWSPEFSRFYTDSCVWVHKLSPKSTHFSGDNTNYSRFNTNFWPTTHIFAGVVHKLCQLHKLSQITQTFSNYTNFSCRAGGPLKACGGVIKIVVASSDCDHNRVWGLGSCSLPRPPTVRFPCWPAITIDSLVLSAVKYDNWTVYIDSILLEINMCMYGNRMKSINLMTWEDW